MSLLSRLYQVAKSRFDLPKVSAFEFRTGREDYDFPDQPPTSSEPPVQGTPDSTASRYFANLELNPGADYEAIKSAYRRLLKSYHPDRHAHDPEQAKIAEAISKGLNEAMNYFEHEREEGRL